MKDIEDGYYWLIPDNPDDIAIVKIESGEMTMCGSEYSLPVNSLYPTVDGILVGPLTPPSTVHADPMSLPPLCNDPMVLFLMQFKKENDWHFNGRLDIELAGKAIRAGFIRDVTPYSLGAEASYESAYQLLPRGRLFLLTPTKR